MHTPGLVLVIDETGNVSMHPVGPETAKWVRATIGPASWEADGPHADELFAAMGKVAALRAITKIGGQDT